MGLYAVVVVADLASEIVDFLIFLLYLLSKLFNNNKYSDQNLYNNSSNSDNNNNNYNSIKNRHQEQRLGGKKRLWKGRECFTKTKIKNGIEL